MWLVLCLLCLVASAMGLTFIGDLHGDLNATKAIMDHCPDKAYVFMGDLMDRGPHGKEIMEYLNTRSEWITVIAGNHDIMRAKDDLDLINLFATNPVIWEFGGILVAHAGVLPSQYEQWKGKTLYNAAKELRNTYSCKCEMGSCYPEGACIREPTYEAEGEVVGDMACECFKCVGYCGSYEDTYHCVAEKTLKKCLETKLDAQKDAPFWTRKLSRGNCELVEETLKLTGNEYMIVGHEINGQTKPRSICNGKLWLVDTGISDWVFGRRSCLHYDLDKDEFTPIEVPNENKQPLAFAMPPADVDSEL